MNNKNALEIRWISQWTEEPLKRQTIYKLTTDPRDKNLKHRNDLTKSKTDRFFMDATKTIYSPKDNGPPKVLNAVNSQSSRWHARQVLYRRECKIGDEERKPKKNWNQAEGAKINEQETHTRKFCITKKHHPTGTSHLSPILQVVEDFHLTYQTITCATECPWR